MDLRKILVIATTLFFFVALIILAHFASQPKSIEITCPVFGDPKAPVEIILFEDFKCDGCRRFSTNILPQLLSEYVVTKQSRLKIVPLGFLDGSKPLANAALEVCHLSLDQFFPYAKLLFASSAEDTLLDMAQELKGIDLTKLKLCIEEKCHYQELDKNLAQAKSLMGKTFLIPAIYINGIRANAEDYNAIRQQIEQAKP